MTESEAGGTVTYTCNGCGFPVPALDQHQIWCRTPLGRIVFWVHDEGCAQVAVSSYREQPCKRIEPPRPTQQERFLGRSSNSR